MTIQLATTTRNARLDAIETEIGINPVLKVRTGAPPADCAAADSGTVLSTMTLPTSWMNDAIGGAMSKSGVWQDLSADNSGNAGHFRIYDNGGAVCHIQGTITATGGGGDMTFDTITFVAGQQVTINSFTLTDANA